MLVIHMTNSSKLIDLIKENEDNILIVEIMPNDMKKEVLKLEMKRLEEMVPLINEGLQKAFDLDECLIVIQDKTGITIPTEDLIPSLTLQSESGTIIGEEVYDPEEIEELKDDPDVYFISDNFPTYPNLSVPGEKQFFVVSEITGEFKHENDLRECVDKMIISAPSTEADHYIKDCYNIPHEEKITTLVVGFN